MPFDCAEMADGHTTAGGHDNKGEKMTMIDLVDTTDQTDTVAHTATLNSDAGLPTSHSAQQDHNDRKTDIGISQELSSTLLQEVISGEDAELTTTDVQTIEQSGTEIGRAETMQDHHAVGYKREHSHSPIRQCSQISPVQIATCVLTGASCVVESQQELVVDGGTLDGGGDQREERQPRKKVKCETMEGEGGGGNGRK